MIDGLIQEGPELPPVCIGKQLSALFAMCLVAYPAAMARGGESVLIVRGTTSMPGVAERDYGRRVAERVSGWLADIGVRTELLTDEDVTRGIPPQCRVLVLAYNPTPPEAELDAIKKYLERGGKLIVFYSSSEPLARLMGMKLGPYKGGQPRGHWGLIRFNTASIPHLPAVVRQRSGNIRAALPASGRSRIIAEWYSDDGRPTGDPAWVASDSGAWMSHILLDDDDIQSKKMMLGALIGMHIPEIWRSVSATMQTQSRALRPGMSFAGSIEEIRFRANQSGRLAAVEPMLQSAWVMDKQITQRSNAGDVSGVISACEKLTATLSSAYASAQSPRWPEWRGVWDHDGTGLYAGDWERTAKELARLGITDILSNVLWPGVAHFPVPGLLKSDIMTLYGDQLEQGISAARKHGLRLHAWKVCWKMGTGTGALTARFGAEGRLQIDDQGRQIPWLCPTQPANRQFELAGLRTILRQYDVTGIHLDYIRYPDSRSCFCPRCREKFQRDSGLVIRQWPRDVIDTGPHVRRYREWRCRQISTFVEACHALISSIRPDVRLSAAVYGRYPLCRDSVAQDWLTWLENDWVDFLCPMDYTEDPLRFAAYVAGQVQACGPKAGRLFPGIGVTAAESRLSGVEVIDQVNTLRSAGARGFALFDLNPILTREVLPLMRMGVLAPAGAN